MQKLILMTLFSTTFLLAACGNKEDEEKKNASYKYSYEYNGCKTEEHSFEGKDAYCAGLKNDELNHFCAWELRKQTYEQECGSDFASRN